MGSPKKAGNAVETTFKQGIGDIRLGIDQVRSGNVVQGVTNYGIGLGNTVMGGSTLAAAGRPIIGETAEREAAQAAQNQEQADINDAATTKELDRRRKITTQLNEAIRLRSRAPGRSQTLLTVGTTPSASNNNTLLTTAQMSMR